MVFFSSDVFSHVCFCHVGKKQTRHVTTTYMAAPTTTMVASNQAAALALDAADGRIDGTYYGNAVASASRKMWSFPPQPPSFFDSSSMQHMVNLLMYPLLFTQLPPLLILLPPRKCIWVHHSTQLRTPLHIQLHTQPLTHLRTHQLISIHLQEAIKNNEAISLLFLLSNLLLCWCCSSSIFASLLNLDLF